MRPLIGFDSLTKMKGHEDLDFWRNYGIPESLSSPIQHRKQKADSFEADLFSRSPFSALQSPNISEMFKTQSLLSIDSDLAVPFTLPPVINEPPAKKTPVPVTKRAALKPFQSLGCLEMCVSALRAETQKRL